MRLPPLRVPVVVAALLRPPGGRRVHVFPVLERLPLSLALPLALSLPRLADRVTVGVVVAVLLAQRVPIGVLPNRVAIHVVVVRGR